MITINQFIKMQSNIPEGLIINGDKKNTKLMFHMDKYGSDINPHYNIAKFENFQKEHWNIFFANTKYILSFWYEGKVAEFIGCYFLDTPIIDKVIDPKTNEERDRYRFPNMRKIDFLSEYNNRLFINWTNPSANYGRWVNDDKYEIHSIKPSKDNSIGSVPVLSHQIRIDYPKLQKLFEYQIDNEDWKNYLSQRSGIYLILDKQTGEQYIGSASGQQGIWQRWKDYAETGDGGNELLKNKNYSNFQFCILWATLNSTDKEIIKNAEIEYKNNLGTKVFGLNDN
ncbi:MAG TPA: GIY-YIG nuclease family protein [Spirochaetota bacterium]|nr:GIY-YIG nuclease family protein [Spirochaetota bacterium]